MAQLERQQAYSCRSSLHMQKQQQMALRRQLKRQMQLALHDAEGVAEAPAAIGTGC
jgi:hypothetical protein